MSLPEGHDLTALRAGAEAPEVPCAFPWCTTRHGATTHPDDEDHRSAGIAMQAVARSPDATAHDTEIEVGLLHRRQDADTWLVIEDGADVHLEVTLDTARRLARALRSDARLSAALGLTPD